MRTLKYLSLLLLFAVTTLFSCSGDEHEEQGLSRSNLSLVAGQNAKLIYNGRCIWKSDEPLIAEVDNNGNVTANRVGETTIWANDESCRVRVRPKYNTYMEPCMDWGASESMVTNFMRGYKNLGKDGNTLGFGDVDNEIVYAYLFENNSLLSSAIGVKPAKWEEVTNFLLERYVVIYVDEASPTAYMRSIDKKIGVAVSFNVSSVFMMVLYAPFNANSKQPKSVISGLNEQIVKNSITKQTSIDVSILNDLLDKFKK